MLKIKWVGSFLASASVVAVLVVNAQAGDVVARVDTDTVTLTGPQASGLGSWVSSQCESVAVADIQRVDCYNGKGCTVVSHETMTNAQYVQLDIDGKAGQILSIDGSNVTVEKRLRCKTTAFNGITTNIGELYSTDVSNTWQGFNAWREETEVKFKVTWLDTLTAAEYVAAKQAGRNPRPRGFVE